MKTQQIQKQNDFIKEISEKLVAMCREESIQLPQDFSIQNALKGAYLKLLETKDKNGVPVLEKATRTSIATSLMQMAVLGLNPLKNQCYFVPYENKEGQTSIICMRSYLGNVQIAKRVRPEIADIYAVVIREKDNIEIEIVNGQEKVISHKTKFENRSNPIVGAYAVAVSKNGEPIRTTIMSMEDIMSSWKKSKIAYIKTTDKIAPDSPHAEFTEEMAKRTAINRLCKYFISTSNDDYLHRALAEIPDEVDENEHRNSIDITDIEKTETPTQQQEALPQQQQGTQQLLVEKKEENDEPF